MKSAESAATKIIADNFIFISSSSVHESIHSFRIMKWVSERSEWRGIRAKLLQWKRNQWSKLVPLFVSMRKQKWCQEIEMLENVLYCSANCTAYRRIFQISVIFIVYSATLASSSSTSSTSSTSSPKTKRQYVYQRPQNGLYLPPNDAARRDADANAQTISQVEQKDSNGNYNYG